MDLKDAYISVTLYRGSQKVSVETKNVPISLPLLWSGFCTKCLPKLMKVPIAILRRLSFLLIIYLDEILLTARTQKELITARDTLIFLLQGLGFQINIGKSALQSCQRIELLRIIVDSTDMTISLPQEKLTSIIEQCELFISKNLVSS